MSQPLRALESLLLPTSWGEGLGFPVPVKTREQGIGLFRPPDNDEGSVGLVSRSAIGNATAQEQMATIDRGLEPPANPPRAPAVSVAMPVLKPHPVYFREAVESVLNQTLTDIELVIVEDPSESSAAELLSRYSDPRIRLITNLQRTSLLEQRNRGILEAKANFVAQLDADDICHPSRLERQLSYLQQHPEVDVIGSHLRVIDGDGHLYGYRYYPETHDAIVCDMRLYNPIANPSVMFRRDRVLEAGAYQFEGGVAEDYEMYCRLASRGFVFATHPEYLLSYRLNPEGTKAEKLREHLRNTIKIKKMYFSDQLDIRARARLWGEHVLLRMPAPLVLRLFMKFSYQSSPRRKTAD